jgi:hypothetical protein
MSARDNQELIFTIKQPTSSMTARVNQDLLLVIKSPTNPGLTARVNQDLIFVILSRPKLVQLTGGPFMDSLGRPLNNGYLIMTPIKDVQTGLGNVVAGIPIRNRLDDNGFMAVGSQAWSTQQDSTLSYAVTAYSSDGRLAWGPHFVTVPVASTFNVSGWIPN